jgi:hypothetical protein
MQTDKPATDADRPAKKAYRAPRLIEWGDLEQITRTAGKSSPIADGGSGKHAKQTS